MDKDQIEYIENKYHVFIDVEDMTFTTELGSMFFEELPEEWLIEVDFY